MVVAEIFGVDGIVVIVVVAVVLLFGGTALPKLARGLGSARHEFESGMKHGDATRPDADPSSPAALGAAAAAAAPVALVAPAPTPEAAPAPQAAPVPATSDATRGSL